MLAVGTGLLSLSSAVAGPSNEKPVEASLVADAQTVAEGQELWLGVHVKLAPGWHLYWQYPGESGFATKIDWEAQNLVTSSPQTLFPVPETFEGAGRVVSYGYAGETLLLAHIPKIHLLPGAREVTVRANARWLVCREDECRDAKQTLELKLPVGVPSPANAELFQRYRKLLPLSSPPSNVKVNTTTSDEQAEVSLQVSVPPGTMGIVAAPAAPPYRALELFPLPPRGVTVTIPKTVGRVEERKVGGATIAVHPEGATISLFVKRGSWTTTGPVTMEGVLVQQWLRSDGSIGEPQANKLQFNVSGL
jgi:DsbC/DsbD-like thiol-disulfide interchange protein